MKKSVCLLILFFPLLALHAQWEDFGTFKRIQAFNEKCETAKFSADGKYIYAIGYDRDEYSHYKYKIKILDTDSGIIIKEIFANELIDTSFFAKFLDVTNNGKYAILSYYNKDSSNIVLIDFPEKKFIRSFMLSDTILRLGSAYPNAKISPDNRNVFFWSIFKTNYGSPGYRNNDFGQVVNLETGKLLYNFKAHGRENFYFSGNARFASGEWYSFMQDWGMNLTDSESGNSFREESGKKCVFYDLEGNKQGPVLLDFFKHNNNAYSITSDSSSYWEIREFKDSIEFHEKKQLSLHHYPGGIDLSRNEKYFIFAGRAALYHFSPGENLIAGRIDLGNKFSIHGNDYIDHSPVDNKVMIYDSEGMINILESPYLSDSLNALIYPQDTTEAIDSSDVQFIDFSTGNIKSRMWDFGDGTGSTDEKPMHKYTKPGSYHVSLIVSDGEHSDTNYTDVIIHEKIKAMFTTDKVKGIAPLTVKFTDKSIITPVAWQWDFGDGSSSEEQDPVHTYADTGRYIVKLIVMNNTISDTLISGHYIDVISEFKADFTVDTTSGNAPLGIEFTDISKGYPYKWEWDFGDGNTSNDTNPKHTYDKPGTYTVTLTTSGGGFEDTEVKKGIIAAGAREDNIFLDSWHAHKGAVTDIMYSKDGDKIYTGGADSLIKIWDAGTHKLLDSIRCPGIPVCFDINPDRKMLAVICETGTGSLVRVYNLNTGKLLKSFDPFQDVSTEPESFDFETRQRKISFNYENDSLYISLIYHFKILDKSNDNTNDYYRSVTLIYSLFDFKFIDSNQFYLFKKSPDLNNVIYGKVILDREYGWFKKLYLNINYSDNVYIYNYSKSEEQKITLYQWQETFDSQNDLDEYAGNPKISKMYFSNNSQYFFGIPSIQKYVFGRNKNEWDIEIIDDYDVYYHHWLFNDLAFNISNDKFLAAFGDEIHIYSFDSTYHLMKQIKYPEWVTGWHVADSPTENIIASGSVDGYVRLWDLDKMVGVEENHNTNQTGIEAWPNPFNDELTIKTNISGAGVVLIIDSFGREVYRCEIPSSGVIRWQPGGLPSGIYFMQLRAGDKLYTKKLILVR